MNEWIDESRLKEPMRYAGLSTCFRKEAGSAGRDNRFFFFFFFNIFIYYLFFIFCSFFHLIFFFLYFIYNSLTPPPPFPLSFSLLSLLKNRGIFRVHQFDKVEQFCLTKPEDSWAELDRMVATSAEFFQVYY